MTIPIKPSEEINFGKERPTSDKMIGIEYLVLAFRDINNIATGSNHVLVKMLETAQAAWTAIRSKTADYKNDTATAEQIMANIGRLMRIEYEGADFVYKCDQVTLLAELALRSDGVAPATSNGDAQYFYNLWFMMGAKEKVEGLFGTWNVNEYKIEDDALAGIWITMFYLITHWQLQTATYSALIKDLGEFKKDGDTVKGKFTPVSTLKQETWPSVLISSEQLTNAINGFGLTTSMLDDETLRGISVYVLDNLEGLLKDYFSQSRWIWKHKHWWQVRPIYSIWGGNHLTRGIAREKFDDGSTEGLQLFKNYTQTQWAWFNREVNEFMDKITNFFYKNKSFGTIKARFKKVAFYDLPSPGEGKGGIIAHQMRYLKESVTVADDIHTKIQLDAHSDGQDVLKTRRSTDQDKVFMTIGDMEVKDYQLMVGHAIQGTKHPDQNSGNERALPVKTGFDPIGGLVIFVSKSEDEDYKIARELNEIVDDGPGNGDMDGIECAPEWVYASDYPNTEYNYPVSINYNKGVFYQNRPRDPYKKLEHKVHDINNLDAQLIQERMLEMYVGKAPSSGSGGKRNYDKDSDSITLDSQDEIPVSAKPVDKAKEHKDKMKEQRELKEKKIKDEKEKKQKATKQEKAVSAKPEEVATSAVPEPDEDTEKMIKAEEVVE